VLNCARLHLRRSVLTATSFEVVPGAPDRKIGDDEQVEIRDGERSLLRRLTSTPDVWSIKVATTMTLPQTDLTCLTERGTTYQPAPRGDRELKAVIA
jgi:hypothetical protein